MINTKPILVATAVRMTILMFVAFGLQLTEPQIVALMSAVEAWMYVFQAVRTSPTHYGDDRRRNVSIPESIGEGDYQQPESVYHDITSVTRSPGSKPRDN